MAAGHSLREVGVASFGALPGLVHGFEQRPAPAERETREESRLRVAKALRGAGELLLLQQVHGAVVRQAPWQGRQEGDGAITDRPGLLLGIETADCLPVLFVDPVRRAVAAVHAGWRGTAAGVAKRAVAALIATGSDPAHILAALGPAIGTCCYEVGEELRAAFGPAGDPFFRQGPRARLHLDVRAANERQLLESGLAAAHIEHVSDCTCCRADLYHSYRRDGAGGGRMISYVGWERG